MCTFSCVFKLTLLQQAPTEDDESLKNMETLGRENVHAAFFEQVGGGVGSVFDETGIHEVLAHRLCHIAGHREGGRRRRGNHSGGFPGVRPAIGL